MLGKYPVNVWTIALVGTPLAAPTRGLLAHKGGQVLCS